MRVRTLIRFASKVLAVLCAVLGWELPQPCSLCGQAMKTAAPAFLLLESWAPRTPTAICQAIFRSFISAFCFSFTSTIPRSPSV